ncbi:MAG: serine/threonine-protein phosphatase [Firmicutes bacterium]|nr:serine/threonine-protein phosphatase [Bacillota bacterium]
MSAHERRVHSLSARMFSTIVKSCIILGLVILIIGLGLYGLVLSQQYIDSAFDLSCSAASATGYGADSVSLSKRVMEKYRSLSEEQIQSIGSSRYKALFAEFEVDHDYEALSDMLYSFLEHNDVYDVYLAMYDEEASRLVYIVDPDPSFPYYPGEWESVNRKGMEKFLNWDGEGLLYDIEKTDIYGWICTTGTPIRDESGNICAFLLVDLTVNDVLRGMGPYALQVSIAIVIITIIMAGLLTRKMNKTVVKPINAIADAAVEYVNDKRNGVNDVDRFQTLNIRTGDEIENLSLVMADMERDLTEIESNLTEVTAKNEKISTELSLAAKIQAEFIPHVFPPFPERTEFSLFATMTPAKEVGGDFYDFFMIDDDHLCMLVADVSGKGIPGALFMMVSKIIIQSCAMLGQTAAEILAKTNQAICSNNEAQMFLTVWVGILDLCTGKLTAANAGHEYPMIKAPDGDYEMLKDRHGFVIGGLDESVYTEYELQLDPGSRIFVYTDGLPEATDEEGRMFGLNRILDVLNEDPGADPEKVISNMNEAVDGFVKNAEQFDDLTMLSFEYKGCTQNG